MASRRHALLQRLLLKFSDAKFDIEALNTLGEERIE